MDGSHEVTKAINAAMWGRYAFLETTLHGGGRVSQQGRFSVCMVGGLFDLDFFHFFFFILISITPLLLHV